MTINAYFYIAEAILYNNLASCFFTYITSFKILTSSKRTCNFEKKKKHFNGCKAFSTYRIMNSFLQKFIETPHEHSIAL